METREDVWAHSLALSQQIPVADGGVLRVSIEDTGSRLNLNALLSAEREPLKSSEAFLVEFLRKVIEEMTPHHVVYRMLDQSGSVSWYESIARPFQREDGEVHVAVVNRDITDRRQEEEQLRARMERMEHVRRVTAVGGLAEAVTHELRQPLTAIANFASGCMRRLATAQSAPEQLHSVLEEIRNQANRADEILSSITKLARGETQRSWVDLHDVIDRALHFVEPDADRAGVTVEFHRGRNVEKLYVDPIQIEQLVLNLCSNAIEAIQAGDPSDRRLTIETRSRGDEVEISVRDRGCGVPPALADRLMEPFVSSKSGGMGLGLSIARAIVDSHLGRLGYSENPDGTTFRVSLPYPRGDS